MNTVAVKPGSGLRTGLIATSVEKETDETMTINFLERKWIEYLPEYIDNHYPKGVSKERGTVTVYVTLFMIEFIKYLKQNAKLSKNP